LGISFDDQSANRTFAERQGYEFPLLCDVERKVGLAYGAARSRRDRFAARYTYVIGPDQRIAAAIDTQDPAAQAGEVLALLTRIRV